MTYQVTSYNCHDLTSWQIQDQTRFEIFRDLSRPFSFFEVQGVVNPAIVLIVGPFEPKEDVGQFWIDHKYLIGPSYLYCRERSAKGWYAIEIQGWDDAQMVIRFHGTPSLLARAIAPLALAHYSLLRPALLYQLSHQGACLLHGAGICRNGRAVALVGSGRSFKTSIAMDCVRLGGYKCLGDDAVIVSNARLYPFPLCPQLFIYRTLYLKNEELLGIPGRIRAINFLRRNDLSTSMSKWNFFATSAVPLAAVVIVGRKCSATQVEIEEIDREAAINLLVAINYLETTSRIFGIAGQLPTAFTQLLDAYALAYPSSRAATFWRDSATVLRHSLGDVPCYKLVLPTVYTEDVFNQVRKVINDV